MYLFFLVSNGPEKEMGVSPHQSRKELKPLSPMIRDGQTTASLIIFYVPPVTSQNWQELFLELPLCFATPKIVRR